MSWKSLSFGLTLIVVFVTGASAQTARPLKECIASVALSDFSSKRAFQVGMHDLTVRENPKFAELAELNMRLQVALARARHMRLNHLLQTDIERLNISQGMTQFTNFEWSKADTSALIRANDRFEALNSEISGLKSRNNGHSAWPAFRKFFAEKLRQNPDYKALLSTLLSERKRSAQRLIDCRAS